MIHIYTFAIDKPDQKPDHRTILEHLSNFLIPGGKKAPIDMTQAQMDRLIPEGDDDDEGGELDLDAEEGKTYPFPRSKPDQKPDHRTLILLYLFQRTRD